MRRLLLAGSLAVLVASSAGAQQWRRFMMAPPRFPTDTSFDGTYNFCRGMFTSVRREPMGQGWSTDYPDADINFSIRLSELTKARVSRRPDGDPNHLVVRLTDPELFKCPLIEMEDVGTIGMSDEEVARLREYLLKGGFLWVDDFWGSAAWEQWTSEIARVLPPREYPIRDLSTDHPIYRTLFEFSKLPQIPSINFWRRTGGLTSEQGEDSAEPHFRAIADDQGRVMVLMTHNTDISDAWEREGEDPRFFYLFSPDGYAVGINVLMYAMTH